MLSHGGLIYERRIRSDLRVHTMIRSFARWLIATACLCPMWVVAQSTDPLPPQTQLVAVSAAPAATQETFTIAAVASGSTQPDLVVTFTDLQTPSSLTAASVVVTQGASIVGTTALAAAATTATLALPAAVGQYTLRVIGTPNATAGAGTFSVCVAPKATPNACIQDASLAGNITVQSAPADPTLTTVSATLTVTTPGSYTFTYVDESFPAPLNSANIAPGFALFQGANPIAVPLPASPATLNLSAGTYTLLGIAQADPTVKAGLFGISVSGPSGISLLNAAYPIGTLVPSSQVNNPSAQSLKLTVTDFAFPTALGSASALVASGATSLGTATATGGASSFAAPQGPLQVWTFGAATTGAGTYEVDLTSAAPASLLQSAFGVSGAGSFAYAFVSSKPLAAGVYQATANDFQFPAALTAVQFAVAQNGAVLKQAISVGSLQFTAAAGPVVLLIDATPSANGNGLVDVNVQTSGSTPQLVFDQLQPVMNVPGGFTSQSITLGTSGNFDVTLDDLKFPAQFQNLALVGTSAGTVLGKVYGAGTFQIAATPGNYQFTIVAIPAVNQQYGLYGIQISNSAPTVTLTASPTSVAVGGLTTLSWTTTSATACTASGGAFSGSQATSGSTSVVVSATTTYTLTCTGPGGSGAQTTTVTATAAPAKSGGGGGIGLDLVGLLGMLTFLRIRTSALSAIHPG
jgi:hypothetical protein